MIEFAANYGQSLDWTVLGDLDPTIRRLYAIGHDDAVISGRGLLIAARAERRASELAWWVGKAGRWRNMSAILFMYRLKSCDDNRHQSIMA